MFPPKITWKIRSIYDHQQSIHRPRRVIAGCILASSLANQLLIRPVRKRTKRTTEGWFPVPWCHGFETGDIMQDGAIPGYVCSFISPYHLVICYIAMEKPLKMEVLMGKSSINGPCSMAMLNYQRVFFRLSAYHKPEWFIGVICTHQLIYCLGGPTGNIIEFGL